MAKEKLFIGRTYEVKEIEMFLKKDRSSILFLKGRRRIGKSWIIDKVRTLHNQNCIIYSGKKSKIDEECYDLLVRIESKFKKSNVSSLIKNNKIDVSSMFDVLISTVKSRKPDTILIIDEIQWMGKDDGLKFSTTLKEKWVELEKTGKFKLILTGSSSRYFSEMVENQDGILRGIGDSSSLTIPPFSLKEVQKSFFPGFSHQESVLIYMITGGIAKYLDILKEFKDLNKSCIYCINQAFFTKRNFFKEEVDNILTVDLSKPRSKTAKKILSAIGANTLKLDSIYKKVSNDYEKITVRQVLQELLSLELIGVKNENGEIQKDPGIIETLSVKQFFIKDLMLLFYFSIIEPRTNKIESNYNNSMIFQECISSSEGFITIPGFSGEAFERILLSILDLKQYSTVPIFKKMGIADSDFDVNTFKNRETQIDCYIKYKTDFSLKIVELKWTSEIVGSINENVQEVKSKKLTFDNFSTEYYYMYSKQTSSKRKIEMKENNVTVIDISDLFES